MLDQLSVDDLKQRLQDKEQTVAKLTAYLEQAAEKLNALKAQKTAPRPAQAFDAESVHRQLELCKQLQAAVDEWQELGVSSAIEGLSQKMDDVRQTILDGFAAQSSPGDQDVPGFEYPSSNESSEEESAEAMANWEALKAEMLGEEAEPEETEEDQYNIDLQAELKVLVNRPIDVEESCHDPESWQEAVNLREAYIISLIRALRVVESRRRGSPDWESFEAAPPELRQQVAQLAADLQQTQRNAEVELSVERARVSRLESEIAHKRRELDKMLKKKGLNPQAAEPSGSKEGRWKKFLGGSGS